MKETPIRRITVMSSLNYEGGGGIILRPPTPLFTAAFSACI
jgi:hypothetical protein